VAALTKSVLVVVFRRQKRIQQVLTVAGGRIEWPKAMSLGAKRRAGDGSVEGVSPSPGTGVRGVTPGEILKFEMQFGAFWQEIDGSPVFHLCERKHCHNARHCRQWY